MSLYLVQHGKNRSKTEDSKKRLSDQGRADTRRIAQVAEGYRIPVSIIRHSEKERAFETARIMAQFLTPERGIEQIDGISPMDPVEAFALSLDARENTMVVGHLPFMERLVGYLVTGNPEQQIFKFQNSGIVCLDKDENGWFISWTLMPKIGTDM